MKTVNALALLNESGGDRGGSVMTRVTIPAAWAREMHISKLHRDLKLEFDGERIIITNNKEEIIMLENLAKELLEIVNIELEEMGFIDDSDNTERFIDSEAYKLLSNNLEDADEAYDLTSELVEEVKSIFTEDIKQAVFQDNYCYYKTEEGLRKWVDLVLANETNDTHTEEDTDKLVNELI